MAGGHACPGGMRGGAHAWPGGSMHGWREGHAWLGGMHAPRPDTMSGRYASYWNALLWRDIFSTSF